MFIIFDSGCKYNNNNNINSVFSTNLMDDTDLVLWMAMQA